MTPPPTLPTLPGLAWSRHKRPGFSTRVAAHVSGREVRVALMSYPLYEFEATYGGLTSATTAALAGLGAASLQNLMGFFLQLLGQAGTFLYTDPDDNAVSGQFVAAGDGATQCFLLGRTLGGFTEPVSWVTSIANVYLNGVAQSSGNWLFTAPNMLAFATAPSAGAAITADFTFAFQCRFLDDSVDFEEFMAALWKLDALKFRSIKANTSAAGAAIPSWYTPYAIGGSNPYLFADFTYGPSGVRYLYNGTIYSSFSSWLTAVGGTCSRSSAKYITNASGNLAQISSGAAPFDYSPTSVGTCNGLRLEGASTNLTLYSNTFTNSYWTANDATVTGLAATGPDGASSASSVVEDSTNNPHYVDAAGGLSVTSANPYTISLYVAPAGRAWCWLYANSGTSARAYFNLSGSGSVGTINGSYSNLSATISQASNGFYRITLTFTPSSSGTIPCGFGLATSNGTNVYTGNGASGVYVWGFQSEAGSVASSYIPTTSSIALRAADSFYLPWAATAFTARVKATLAAFQGGNDLIDCGSGLLTQALGPSAQTSNGTQGLATGIASFTQSNIIVVGGSPSGRVIAANGNTAAGDSNALVPSAPSTFYIGENASGSNNAYGDYAQIGLWNVAAAAAQAATLSGLS